MEPPPEDLSASRLVLHRLAEERIAPARAAVTGRIDLLATPGGFGTPVFDGDRQLRTDGATLVTHGRGEEMHEPIPGADDAAARWLGHFFALAMETLTELGRDLPREHAPSAPKLWPEHFDYAIDAGEVRANYGFSPGDEERPYPYLYVGRWEPATLEVVALADAGDPLAWLRGRHAALHSGAGAGGGLDGVE